MGTPALRALGFSVSTSSQRGRVAVLSKAVAESLPEVFQRDDCTCRYCGFRSTQWQEVHRTDGQWEEDAPVTSAADGETVCFLCHLVLHLDVAGEQRAGRLIWLPEIGQAALHHIVRAIWVAQGVVGEPRTWAQSALGVLESRVDEARKRLDVSPDPGILADAISDLVGELGRDGFDARRGQLAGLRLLPEKKLMRRDDKESKNIIGEAVMFWRSADQGPYGKHLPKTWADELHKASAQLGIS